MANVKKKSKVKGLVPAEVVKAVATGKENPSVALYNSLSINVKTGESPEEREQRKFRRRYICQAFGMSADELEHFLEEHKKFQTENKGPSMSEIDILRDKENVSRGQHGAVKAQDRSARDMIFNSVKTIATLAGFKFAPGLTIIATIVGLAIGLRRNRKAKVGQVSDGVEKDRDFVDYLGGYMDKVDAMNKYLEADMPEIMAKKKELKPKQFSQYMKLKMAQIKDKMRQEGYEISDVPEEKGTKKASESETSEKPKTTKKSTSSTKKKKAAEPAPEATEDLAAGEKEA